MRNNNVTHSTPGKWPFPPLPKRGRRLPRPTRGAMVADICMVIVWGASIPGMLWLGTAGGF